MHIDPLVSSSTGTGLASSDDVNLGMRESRTIRIVHEMRSGGRGRRRAVDQIGARVCSAHAQCILQYKVYCKRATIYQKRERLGF